jgi:hypothetical protein
MFDPFLLPETLFNESVDSFSVLHDIDNLSDHEPISLIYSTLFVSKRQFKYTRKKEQDEANKQIKINENERVNYIGTQAYDCMSCTISSENRIVH